MRLAPATLALAALLASSMGAAEVARAQSAEAREVYHTPSYGPGVSRALRKTIAAIIRSHVAAAGYRFTHKKHAAWLFSSAVRKEGARLVVDLRFRRRADPKGQEAIALAMPDTVFAIVGDLLQQVMPRSARPGDSEPPRGSVFVKDADTGRKVLSTWVEDQPKWGDLRKPGTQLAPFPPLDDPPPEIGDIPR
jgi:hypothetical protein